MDNAVTEFKSSHEGSEFHTCFKPAALHELKREVIRGYKSIPRRGAEVGGLLRGVVSRDAGNIRVTIHKIVPVPIEYRFGPSWRLSNNDNRNFQKAIADDARGEIIGWYRSHTRPADGVEADRLHSAKFFPDGSSVFLTCYPDADLCVKATLRLWKAGADECELSFDAGRFSLLDDALQSSYPDDEAETVPPARLPEPQYEALQTEPQQVAPPTKPRYVAPMPPRHMPPPQRRSLYLRGALIAALALIMTGAVGFFLRNHSESGNESAVAASTNTRNTAERPGSPSTGLGMKVEKQGNSLHVSWDRDDPQIRQATEGSFLIAEGDRSRVLQLSSRELLNGGLLYTSSGKDVRLELEVRGPAGSFGESMRVVGSDWTPEENPKERPVSTYKAPSEPRLAPVSIPATPKPQDMKRQETKQQETKLAEFKLPEQKPPDQKPAESKRPELKLPEAKKPEPSQVITATDAPQLQASLNAQSSVSPQLPGLPPRFPSIDPAARRGTTNPPLAARPLVNGSELVPARAIQSFQPVLRRDGSALSPSAFSQSNASQEIDVDVTIDVHGNVTKASVSKSKGVAANLLVQSALDAAWKWRFAPATMSDKPVESRMTLKFVFSKSQR